MRRNPSDYERAVEWTREAAQSLASMPPPTPGQADDAGLASGTWSPVVGYTMYGDDAPVEAHMAAISAMRLHSKTQLDRGQWETAYNAIKREYERATGKDAERVQKPEHKVYVVFHGTPTGAYRIDPKFIAAGEKESYYKEIPAGLWVHIPTKYDDIKSMVWYGFAPFTNDRYFYDEGRKWVCISKPKAWLRLAANLEFIAPVTAKYILKNAMRWAEQIGEEWPEVMPEFKAPIVYRSPDVDEKVVLEIHAEPYKGMPPGIWIDTPWRKDYRGFSDGIDASKIKAGRLKGDDGFWRFVHPDAWERFADNLDSLDFPYTAELIRKNAAKWRARIGVEAKAPVAPPKPVVTGSADAGSFAHQTEKPIKWKWDKDNFQVLFYGDDAKDVLDLTRQSRDTASTKSVGGAWYTAVPVINAAEFVEKIKPERPHLSEALKGFVAEWGSIKSSLKQSKERGTAEGGRWEFISGGEPTLKFSMGAKAPRGALNWVTSAGGTIEDGDGQLPYANLARGLAAIERHGGLSELHDELSKRKTKWAASGPSTGRGSQSGVNWSMTIPSGVVRLFMADAKNIAPLISGAVYGRETSGAFEPFIDIPEKKLSSATDEVLTKRYPRLAEALNRAFGGAAMLVEEEAEACRKLAALSGARSGAGDETSYRSSSRDAGAVEYDDIKEADARAEVEATAATLARVFPAGMAPYPYQVIGATFARLSGYRCMIADEPGLGKTIQAIACIALDPGELLPALIVAPASVCGEWQKQIAKWLPRVPQAYLEGESAPLPPEGFKGVVIASWDGMRNRRVGMLTYGFRFFVADEAHKAKNLGATQTQVARLLAIGPSEEELKSLPEGTKGIPHVLFLSGTPVKNTVLDLWPQLSAIQPDAWGKLDKFKKQYAVLTAKGRIEQKIPGYAKMSPMQQDQAAQDFALHEDKALSGLRDRLKCTMIRRLKQDAVRLPPKYRVTVGVRMARDIREEYRQAASEFLAWLEQAVRSKLLALGFDEGTADEDALAAVERALKAEAIVRLGRLREIAGRGKIPAAIRMGQRLARAGEPFLYFCDHAEVVDALAKSLKAAGVRYAIIDGKTTKRKRSEAVEAFQDARTVDALICTTAAKEGLTLTRAAVTLFVEHFWTAADEQQAEDRIHRISQTRPATIAYLHAPSTVDDYMAELVTGKRSLTRDIMGAEEVAEDEEQEERAREAAKDSLLHGMIARLQLNEGSIFATLRDAAQRGGDRGLIAWMDSHRDDVEAAMHAAIYPSGPVLEPEEKVVDDILIRLRSATRTNPRRR